MYNPRFVSFDGPVEIVHAPAQGAIAANDFVTYKADGDFDVCAAGNPIAGIAINAASVADVEVYAIRARRGMKVLMDNDNVGTTFAATHVGGRFDIIGSTGAQLVDTSSVAQVGDGTDSGQLLCTAYSPNGYGFDGDASIGIFEIAEVQ